MRHDITGQEFGRLTVVSHVGYKFRNRKEICALGGRGSSAVWLCSCVCGSEHAATTHDLRSGNVTSCGCAQYPVGEDHANFRHGLARKGKVAPEYRMWRHAKERAQEEGVPFEIEPQDIVIPETCPVLGIPLRVGVKRQTANSPSLDKVVPAVGYTRKNIRVISYRANTIKQNASAAEIRAVANYVERESHASI